jgi:hypothetical protein
MDAIKTIDGHLVTEETLDRWSEALDRDEWPEGWVNVGPVTIGRPPMSAEGSTVLSVKIPVAMKKAIENEAKGEGISTSDYVRSVLVSDLVSKSV